MTTWIGQILKRLLISSKSLLVNWCIVFPPSQSPLFNKTSPVSLHLSLDWPSQMVLAKVERRGPLAQKEEDTHTYRGTMTWATLVLCGQASRGSQRLGWQGRPSTLANVYQQGCSHCLSYSQTFQNSLTLFQLSRFFFLFHTHTTSLFISSLSLNLVFPLLHLSLCGSRTDPWVLIAKWPLCIKPHPFLLALRSLPASPPIRIHLNEISLNHSIVLHIRPGWLS